MKKALFAFMAFILGGCISLPAAKPTGTAAIPYILAAEENPYGPRPEDSGLRIAGVILTSIDLSERTDLTPNRVELGLLGSMPSVCNQLRIKVNTPNDQYQIFVEVYSLVNPNINCDNVFQLFNTSILLGVYSPGRYTVWINNGLIGDFISG